MGLSILGHLGFAGGEVTFIDQDVVVYLHGNGLAISDLTDLANVGPTKFVTNNLECPLGISAFTTSVPEHLVAFAPRSAEPCIHVLKYPQLDPLSVLRGGTDLEYESIAISHNAKMLCAVSGPFDHHLYLWSLEIAQTLAKVAIGGNLATPCTWHNCSFSPKNSSMVCTGGSYGLVFWKVQVVNDHKLQRINAVIGSQEDAAEDGNVLLDSISAQCWTQNNLVLAVGRSSVMEFDAQSGILTRLFPLAVALQESLCLFVTAIEEIILLLFSNGIVQGIRTSTSGSTEFMLNVAKEPCSKYSWCSLLPRRDGLLLSGPGRIQILTLNGADASSSKIFAGPNAAVIDYHNGPVLGMACQSINDPTLVTAGADGALGVWTRDGTLVGKHKFQISDVDSEDCVVSITSITSAPCNSNFAVGTSIGCIFLLSGKPKSQNNVLVDLVSLGNLQLCREPITSVIFHPEKDILAAISESNAFIVDTSPQKGSISLCVLAHTSFSGHLASLCALWCNDYLMVAFAGQSIISYLVDSDAHSLNAAWKFETDFPCAGMSRLKFDSNGVTFLATSPISCDIMALASSDAMYRNGKLVVSKIESSHDKGVMCLGVSNGGELVATGGVDGRIALWRALTESGVDLVKLCQMNLHTGPVAYTHFSLDTSILYSSGSDGAVFSLNILVPQTLAIPSERHKAEHPKLTIQHVPIPAMSFHQATWCESCQEQIEKLAALKIKSHEAAQRSIIANLRSRLLELVAKNNDACLNEKLERNEFIIDRARHRQVLTASQRKANELEKQLRVEKQARDVISARIRHDCWDCMEVQATECHSFLTPRLLTSNFPLKLRADKQKHCLECVCFLRKLALRQSASSISLSLDSSVLSRRLSHNISWMVNQGKLLPSLDLINIEQHDSIASIKLLDGALENDGNDDEEARLSEEAWDENLTTTQLYQPIALHTSIQKRIQCVLVGELLRQAQADFNFRFGLLHDEKRIELGRILEKTDRLQGICGELGIMEDYFKHQFAVPEETPEVMIQVDKSEIYSSTPEATTCMVRKSTGLNADNTDDYHASKRALEDMMYGTLETKKETDRLQTVLQAPSWIDDQNHDDLTSEQKKELEEFETAKGLLAQQQAKYRKALELEFKKLRTEVSDIACSFDDKLKRLADHRVFIMNFVTTQELYSSRMCVGLLKNEARLITLSRLGSQISTLNLKKDCQADIVTSSLSLVSAESDRLNRLQAEDKNIDRHLKRDLQVEKQMVQEDIKLVLSYFRRKNLSLEEKPDDWRFDDTTWQMLLSSRKHKVAKEAMISDAAETLGNLRAKHANSLVLFGDIEQEIVKLRKRQAKIRAELATSEVNCEILVQVRQGQNEVDAEAAVTDYFDAIFLPVETIQGINQVITQLGTEQIKTLTKIKHFRKSINYMEWESSFLKAQSHDLEEYYTDLQLLHVTKSLQSVLKGNQSTTAAPEQIAREEARISILIKANEKKLSTLTNTNSKLVQQIQAREDENKRLHLQLNQINDAIIVREAITRSQLNSFTEEANAEQRTRYHMKRITLRRRLIDLVRLIAYFFVYTISE